MHIAHRGRHHLGVADDEACIAQRSALGTLLEDLGGCERASPPPQADPGGAAPLAVHAAGGPDHVARRDPIERDPQLPGAASHPVGSAPGQHLGAHGGRARTLAEHADAVPAAGEPLREGERDPGGAAPRAQSLGEQGDVQELHGRCRDLRRDHLSPE